LVMKQRFSKKSSRTALKIYSNKEDVSRETI
jgi:hypothetical protein